MNNTRRLLLSGLVSTTIFCAANSGATDTNTNKSQQSVYLQSGADRVELIELYTSEGCSSCPPADDWLSDFVDSDKLWDRIVPMAFHVDYWDYIGWADRFADASFTDRQRDHAARLGMRTIYTPGVFLSGSEWQRWRRETSDFPAEAAGGRLDAIIDTGASAFTARFVADGTNAQSEKDLVLHTAILGFDLVSEVNRGENKGRKLKHDFVVLGYQQTRLSRLEQNEPAPNALAALDQRNETQQAQADSTTWFIQTNLPTTTQTAEKQAVALWVSQANDSEPLQATGGWL